MAVQLQRYRDLGQVHGDRFRITDNQWFLSAGALDATLSYTVVESHDDTVEVSLKTERGDNIPITCRIDGNTLRITQSVNSTFGVGGTWTRQ